MAPTKTTSIMIFKDGRLVTQVMLELVCNPRGGSPAKIQTFIS